jgi:hypothetical protein
VWRECGGGRPAAAAAGRLRLNARRLQCNATPISYSVARCVSRLGVVSFPVCGCVCVCVCVCRAVASRSVGGSLRPPPFAAGSGPPREQGEG